MNDLKLDILIAKSLGLTFNIENGGVYVYEKSEVETFVSTFERVGTMDNGTRILAVCFSPSTNWDDLMPLVLENHIQTYVHSEDHYNIDVNGFHKLAVHKSNVKRVLAECLLKVLVDKKESDSE